jgi:hypothetical protein
MSTQTIRDSKGFPIITSRSGVLLTTNIAKSQKPITPEQSAENIDKMAAIGVDIAPWGTNNQWPQEARLKINKSTVLKPGLRYKADVIAGQGIFPVFVTGFDANQNEIYKTVNDPEVTNFLQSRMVRRYVQNASRDVLKFGLAFPELLPDTDGKKIVGIDVKNAMFCRWQMMDKEGNIPNMLYCGLWPDAKEENTTFIPVLNNYDPLLHLQTLRDTNKLKKSLIYPLRDEFDNQEYYPLPDWFTTEESGWLEIARQIPDFIRNMYKNPASFKYHIKVPYWYWEERFPESNYASRDEMYIAIDAAIDAFIESVSDTANANKAILTHTRQGSDGKMEGVEITEFSARWSNEQLMTSAIANSEILAALGINPAVRGLMPGSSIYAGNSGGSNIREAHLIDCSLAYGYRSTILDPLEAILQFNGFDPSIQLRFRNVFLTTLDTGGGTGKTIS